MNNHKIGDILNTRAVVSRAMCDMAESNPGIWALTSDCGGNLRDFIERYPDRFVDTGIAEQNAAGIAAGLALSGAVPYIVGMTPFVTMRCFEQNRTAIAYQNLPVRIVGWVGGMTSGGGSTHYALEDIAIMRSIANMRVVSISDPLMAYAALRASETAAGPMFLRLTMAKADPVIYEPGSVPFELGRGILAHEGGDTTLLVHGGPVRDAIRLAAELDGEGVHVRVVDMWSIKPLDRELVLDSVRKTGKMVVWEDHFASGGLASAVADCLVDAGVAPEKFVRVGIPETYPGFGPSGELYKKYGMDPETVKGILRQMA
ncbi:MAG: transketolase [Clostridiales bacterium]|nr:transketolase [Clostridiales bacterium]